MRPGNTALLVIAATGVDQHVEAVDVQQVAAYLDAKNRGLRIHREFIAPVPAAQRPQVFAGHTRNGELHEHAAFALANALDLELAQVSLHERTPPLCPSSHGASRVNKSRILNSRRRGIIIAHANCRVTGIRRWQMPHGSSTTLWWAAGPPAAHWPPVCRRMLVGRSACSRRALPARAGLSMYRAPSCWRSARSR